MDDFDLLFWPNYPVHRAKRDARKAWDKLAPDQNLTLTIIQALQAQVVERRLRMARGQWVPEWPLPASWLRGERWDDEVQAAVPQDTHRARTAEVKRLIEQEGLTPAEAAQRVGYR